MRTTIRASFDGLAPREDIQSGIVRQAKRLDHAEADILHCHVYVARSRVNELHHVEVHLTLRGGEMVSVHGPLDEAGCEDVQHAVWFAFEALAEKLAATRPNRHRVRSQSHHHVRW